MPDHGLSGHRIVVEWEGGYSSAKLICPESGCEPAVMCGECFRHREDTEREPCEHCPTDDECVLAPWFSELGEECMNGRIELAVESVEWGVPDEGPTVHVALLGQPGATA